MHLTLLTINLMWHMLTELQMHTILKNLMEIDRLNLYLTWGLQVKGEQVLLLILLIMNFILHTLTELQMHIKFKNMTHARGCGPDRRLSMSSNFPSGSERIKASIPMHVYWRCRNLLKPGI